MTLSLGFGGAWTPVQGQQSTSAANQIQEPNFTGVPTPPEELFERPSSMLPQTAQHRTPQPPESIAPPPPATHPRALPQPVVRAAPIQHSSANVQSGHGSACDAYPVQTPPCPPAVPCAPPCPPERKVKHVYLPRPSCDEPAEGLPAQQPLPPGAFVAPPQAGTLVEEQRSTGIRGLSITFPAIKLELPTIELPSWIRRERGAHMELDRGIAPYVAGAGVQRQVSFAGAQLPVRRRTEQPAQAPPPEEEPAKADDLQSEYDKLKDRCNRLEALLEQMVQRQAEIMQCQPPQLPCPPTYCPPPGR